ncbi:MAG: DUF3046 domain-containing protein [Propionibacteriaceae bacterium]|nr:DUF3046 domain-containing protein [Propionibacteriaceae bacterium]
MRETELWARLTAALGPAYATTWADQVALPTLGSRTVSEALKAGLPCKTIWRAAWEWLELAPHDR